jgi:hypothetical protein
VSNANRRRGARRCCSRARRDVAATISAPEWLSGDSAMNRVPPPAFWSVERTAVLPYFLFRRGMDCKATAPRTAFATTSAWRNGCGSRGTDTARTAARRCTPQPDAYPDMNGARRTSQRWPGNTFANHPMRQFLGDGSHDTTRDDSPRSRHNPGAAGPVPANLQPSASSRQQCRRPPTTMRRAHD